MSSLQAVDDTSGPPHAKKCSHVKLSFFSQKRPSVLMRLGKVYRCTTKHLKDGAPLNASGISRPDRMSGEQRLAELARILARAIVRLQSPDKSAQNSGIEP